MWPENGTYEKRRLKELLTLEYGESLPDDDRAGGSFPVLGSNGVVGFHNEAIVSGPGIVIGRKGSIGQVTWVEENFWPIDTTYYVAQKTSHDKRWLYYLLQQLGLDRLNSATGVPGLNRDDAYALHAPVPTESQSQKIAHILRAIDNVIEETRAVIEQTRRLKSALLQDLLTNGLPGRHRKFKSARYLTDIPADWQILSMEKLGDGKRPALRTGPFGSSLKTKHFTTGGRPVLTIGSLGEGEIQIGELFYVDEAKALELREYEVEPGDVVFSRVADVGRSVTIPEGADGWIISSNLMRIAVDKSRFDPWFIRQSLVHSRHLKKQMRRLTADAGREIVNSDVLSSLLFPMPDREEQNQIAEVIRRVDERIWKDREVLSQLVKTKSALSQGLLTGQIPVNTTNKEVA